MTRPTFAAISSVLVEKFKVDAAKIEPATTLEQLAVLIDEAVDARPGSDAAAA